MTTAEYLLQLPDWPSFDLGEPQIDGLIPTCKVSSWRGFQEALTHDFFHRPGTDLIYRGHRRHEWQLTPTLGRYSPNGVIHQKQAERQLEEFRYAMRGRGANFSRDEDASELWAYGQHHGLATPLLDWTLSPFVALFFAVADTDPEHELPNLTRPIFVLNYTAIEALDPTLVVEPMRNDHTRLINQAGLFTLSPLGEETLITRIMNLLADDKVEMDSPNKVAEYICKIHIPVTPDDRFACLRALKMMNIHHGTLFPDAIGASRYCNEWVGSQAVAEVPAEFVNAQAERAQPEPRVVAVEEHAPPEPGRAADELSELVDILKAYRQGTVLPGEAQLKEQAALISRNYSDKALLDWHRRSNGEAQLRVQFKRLLKMQGWPNSTASDVVNALLGYYRQQASALQRGP